MIKQEQEDTVNSNLAAVASTKEEIVATVDTVAVVAMVEATRVEIEEDSNSVAITTKSTRLLFADISNKQANALKVILAHLPTVIMSFVVYKILSLKEPSKRNHTITAAVVRVAMVVTVEVVVATIQTTTGQSNAKTSSNTATVNMRLTVLLLMETPS